VRVSLRRYRLDDVAAVHAYATDPPVYRFVEWGPNTLSQTTAWVEWSMTCDSAPRWAFAIERIADRMLIGSIELVVDDEAHRRGSFGYTLARHAWGRGYATEAAAAMLAFGFDEAGLHKISATCDPENIASSRVLQKIGMRLEGQLQDHLLVRGEWRDRLLYAAAQFRIEPATVPDLPEVRTLLDDVDPDELRAFAEDRRLFVARRGTLIAGLAGWAGDRLRHVCVDPAWSRRARRRHWCGGRRRTAARVRGPRR
jgi:RimJ/RimL family protein N-acetyltransferase